jgi:hypothetical protein
MPPLEKGAPFKRKDIAKAFFDLDLSGSGPSTASKTPKPREHNRPVASQPPATNEARLGDDPQFRGSIRIAPRDRIGSIRSILTGSHP